MNIKAVLSTHIVTAHCKESTPPATVIATHGNMSNRYGSTLRPWMVAAYNGWALAVHHQINECMLHVLLCWSWDDYVLQRYIGHRMITYDCILGAEAIMLALILWPVGWKHKSNNRKISSGSSPDTTCTSRFSLGQPSDILVLHKVDPRYHSQSAMRSIPLSKSENLSVRELPEIGLAKVHLQFFGKLSKLFCLKFA